VPGHLEPQPRRGRRLAVLVHPQPATRPGPTRRLRTAPRTGRHHPGGVPLRDRTRAVPPRRATAGETLWRLLYESAARAGEVLALNIEDLDLDARRAPIRSKGGDTEWIYWGSGTARLLPRLLRGREAGPVFLSERQQGPARRPATADLCPTTGRARLGYDRARILFGRYTGWDLHQLRHFVPA
jgi:integrase